MALLTAALKADNDIALRTVLLEFGFDVNECVPMRALTAGPSPCRPRGARCGCCAWRASTATRGVCACSWRWARTR